MEPGSVFESVQRFVDPDARDRTLAAEALFRSLRDIPLTVSDPAVGAAKLAWWQRELSQARQVGSQHPVVRALIDTGAVEVAHLPGFNDYLHALVVSLQSEAVGNMASLAEELQQTAGVEAVLVAGMSSAPEPGLRAAGSAARLYELMRTLARVRQEHRWLPLDLVARHGYRRGEADPAALAALVKDLARLALDWRSDAPLDPAQCDTAGARFIALRDLLVGRRLIEATRRPEHWLTRGQRPGIGDVLASWRLARRLGTRQRR